MVDEKRNKKVDEKFVRPYKIKKIISREYSRVGGTNVNENSLTD